MIIDPTTLKIPHFEDILSEHQDQIKDVLEIPKDVLLQSESVAGQLASNSARQSYELFLSFQALMGQMDARSALGFNLDRIASIRGLSRLPNENDDDFRKRITGYNEQSKILTKKDILTTQLENISGVNKANVIYKNGEIWVIVSGGSDQEICDVLTKYSPLGLHRGDDLISCDCKNFLITRAREAPLRMVIEVKDGIDGCMCGDGDIEKIPEIIASEACDYTAGSAIKEDHIKNTLGRYGYVVGDVFFEIEAGKMLAFNVEEKESQDPCEVVDDRVYGGWNESCWNASCGKIRGKNILLPHFIIPKICVENIEVKKA